MREFVCVRVCVCGRDDPSLRKSTSSSAGEESKRTTALKKIQSNNYFRKLE